MKAITKTALATVATLAVLTTGVAQANPVGYGYPQVKIGYDGSFNTTNKYNTRIDNSKRVDSRTNLNYDLDNSVRNRLNQSYRLNSSHDYRSDNLNANQNLNQKRNYFSNVGQNATNQGGASGHSMGQKQGGTAVGTLVSESNANKHKGHNIASPTYSRQYGNTSSGNMLNSQIGSVQSGMQGGNVTNLQANDQDQTAVSFVSSDDDVSNSAAK